VTIFLSTPAEILHVIAKQAQAKRLALNMTQKTLSDRSGVSFGVIKKFERTGKISLESLLKIALVLDALEACANIFKPMAPIEFTTLDALLKDNTRKRGRT